jgi:CHAT domain-containing protein/tetratricopeptide (TPR) repeat protein
VSREIADNLMKAESAEAFLRGQNGAPRWQTVLALKTEVDRLVTCDLHSAALLTDRIEQVAQAAGDPPSVAFANASRARVLTYSGRHVDADMLYQRAARDLSGAKLPREAARIQMQQLTGLTLMGKFDDALRLARAARRVIAQGEPVELAQLETNVGNIYYKLDRYNKALDHYNRASELLGPGGDDSMRALIDFSRSNVFTDTDRPDEALRLLETAASAWDRAGAALHAALARHHIAYIHFLRGAFGIALSEYHRVRDEVAGFGSTHIASYCDLEMAEMLLALNAFDDAAEGASAARSQFEKLGVSFESARSTMLHGLAVMGLGQFDIAGDLLAEARELFAAYNNKTFVALVDCYLAELAIRRSDPAEASQRAAASRRLFSRQGLAAKSAYARLLEARAHHGMGDHKRAARMARLALTGIESIVAPSVAFQSHHLIGRIESGRGRRGAALASFRRAVELVEQMRGGIVADEFKATFLRDKIEVYEDAIAACLDEGDQHHIEEAFKLVESAKSRALADLLSRYARETTHGARVTDDTRQRLSKLIEDLNWYNSHAGLEDDKGEQRSAEIASRYRRVASTCERKIALLFRRLQSAGSDSNGARRPAASVSDLQDLLEPGEAAVEFFTTGDQVSAFVATDRHFSVARNIASKSEVEREILGLRFQIEKFNYGAQYVEKHFGQLKRSTDDHLARLFQMTLDPIRAALDGERLLLIPHSVLHYVPFHALRDGENYLIDRLEVSYAPSSAVFKLCHERRTALRRAPTAEKTPQVSPLNTAFETTSDARHRPLRASARRTDCSMVALGITEAGTPNIEHEICALGSLFPDSVRLTGTDATRENLFSAAPRARYLHLASHGYFRRDNPMFSFLKLADSHLNFYSLIDLKLSAEMVTLSACHTGINMVFPGDELHGLMRGFLHAGAPSVVASLWAVSDHSTADFMRELYSKIREGSSKRAALRQAQLAIKDAYGHPYYWAPFVLMGDPG